MLKNVQALRGVGGDDRGAGARAGARSAAWACPAGTSRSANAGVDIFFVISGMIIGRDDRPPATDASGLHCSIASSRVVPLYWAVTFAGLRAGETRAIANERDPVRFPEPR